MTRYLTYLSLYIAIRLFALIVTPLLPLFAANREGPINNNSDIGTEPRLPTWLSWFDTPDNSLLGDLRWKTIQNSSTYWSMVKWLYRNSCYGFAWTVLGAPMPDTENKYWQYRVYNKVIRVDFGWLLLPYESNPDLYKTQPKALFQFSIRKGK